LLLLLICNTFGIELKILRILKLRLLIQNEKVMIISLIVHYHFSKGNLFFFENFNLCILEKFKYSKKEIHAAFVDKMEFIIISI
jgi:hypothetical protein